jgi:putative ABC transport system permease protein
MGVMAVIIMTAIGRGAERAVVRQIEKMGTNLLVVNAGKEDKSAIRSIQERISQTLILEDSDMIPLECPLVALSAPGQEKNLQVKYENFTTTTKIFGTLPDFLKIRNFNIELGRMFTEEENRASFRLAVIGSSIRDSLFKGDDPIGETIRIRNIPFEVIGVLKSKGLTAEGADEDNQIFIPIKTALRRVFNLDYIRQIYIQVQNRRLMAEAEQQVRELLRERHRLNRRNNPDDFTIQSQLRAIQAEKETSESFSALITGIAAISLFVGGFGILAVMLLAVKERTFEIGLRMAAGARPKDILVQFLAEALILGTAGGSAGILLGITGAWITGRMSELETYVSLESVYISLSVSLLLGLLFGVIPARKASLLHPIEALRAE